MTSKFEQLIEYVINDEEAKAKELFHDIVVEKSREIYENLMSEEEELDEAAPCDEEEELDESAEESDEELDESEEDLMNDVEAEEQGMQEEEESDEEMDVEMDSEEESGENLEDRVVDLEDKLDELMAEFESLMGDEAGEESSDEVVDIDGGDALEMDDTETAEFGGMDEMGMMENVSLSAAPKPVTTEPAGTNTKSTVTANSGARGMQGAPVKMTGDTAQGRPAPTSGELIGKVQNSVGGSKKLSPAAKPHLAQATGVNTKTPFPKG